MLLAPLVLCEEADEEEAVPAGGGAKMNGVCTEEVGVQSDDPPPF